MDTDELTTAHCRRLVKKLGSAYAASVNVNGRWSASTICNYTSVNTSCVAPPALMFALCDLNGDWAWLDGLNAAAGRQYLPTDHSDE